MQLLQDAREAWLRTLAAPVLAVDLRFCPSSHSAECIHTGAQHAGIVSACSRDSLYSNAISDIRAELPRPYTVSTAAFSVGAYGQGAFAKALPGSDYTGMAVNVLKAVGSKVGEARAHVQPGGSLSPDRYLQLQGKPHAEAAETMVMVNSDTVTQVAAMASMHAALAAADCYPRCMLANGKFPHHDKVSLW